MTTSNKAGLAVALYSLLTSSAAIADDDFLDMSLEELVSLEVTSVSRKSQSIMSSAAAVYAITQEDIRRSGARTIPDLLRMVPGLQVAKINSNIWSVSSRGFNGVFSNTNKLLVLIDGRSIYSPLYSGITWETNDVMLADIERIEVIRGPGAAPWGSNAFNGVINIITRPAAATQGTYVEAGAGSYAQEFGSIRHGGQLGENATYRAYYKYSNYNHQKNLNSTLAQKHSDIDLDKAPKANDGWHMNQTGFRVDWDQGVNDLFTFQGDLYKGHIRPAVRLFDRQNGTSTYVSPSNRQFGANTLGRWTHTLSTGSEVTTQIYYERYENDDVRAPRHHDTWDVDFHHRFQLTENQEIIWGSGYRRVDNKVHVSDFVEFDSRSRTTELYSAFIQDEITLVPDRWHATLSARFENNEFTGDEIQPNARIIFTPDAEQSLWAAISRTIRTPAIVEVDARAYGLSKMPYPGQQDVFTAFSGNDKLKSETLLAYELGYRRMFSEDLTVDTTIFLNHYKDLVASRQGSCQKLHLSPGAQQPPLCQPVNSTSFSYFPATIDNVMKGDVYGFEVAADWQAMDNWMLKLSYSFIQMDLHSTIKDTVTTRMESVFETMTAKHNVSLMSHHDFPDNWELDLWLRYRDSLRSVSPFMTADLRIAKRLDSFEFAIVGQNLLDSQHLEYLDTRTSIATTEVPRSIYGQIIWRY